MSTYHTDRFFAHTAESRYTHEWANTTHKNSCSQKGGNTKWSWCCATRTRSWSYSWVTLHSWMLNTTHTISCSQKGGKTKWSWATHTHTLSSSCCWLTLHSWISKYHTHRFFFSEKGGGKPAAQQRALALDNEQRTLAVDKQRVLSTARLLSILFSKPYQEQARGGGLGSRPKKCTGRGWGMGSSTI